jgi:hypothetical protein
MAAIVIVVVIITSNLRRNVSFYTVINFEADFYKKSLFENRVLTAVGALLNVGCIVYENRQYWVKSVIVACFQQFEIYDCGL